MTVPAASRPVSGLPGALFVVTVFASAALVFLVQPMVAKLVLPLLGGSPSVWNTSMAFFQIALLAGYGYAHALQKAGSVRAQATIHCAALVIAAIALPLRVQALAGPPSSEHPNLWLLAVLALSVGAPFAVLSATAPLVQAWYARTVGAAQGKEPYALYAASNLGSLLALLGYPVLIEPIFALHGQTIGWSLGYGAFAVLIGVLALRIVRAQAVITAPPTPVAGPPVGWRRRLTWVTLAAIPSSLMLGVTTHITTDVASAPFLWVLPLALYLVTFIVAFQVKPAISPERTLLLQAAAVAACAAMLPYNTTSFAIQLPIHLAAFFLTALMCHQALVARRPDAARLTEFYLWMSVGGVAGGAFNAFVAPVIFQNVWEYPLVLALSCLVRPWGERRIAPGVWVLLAFGIGAAVLVPVATTLSSRGGAGVGDLSASQLYEIVIRALLITSLICAFLLRGRALFFFAVIAMLSVGANLASDRTDILQSWRSFFGVVRESRTIVPSLGGEVRMLAHGTTLHGAQAQDPAYRCRPLVYYTPSSPIGQVFAAQQREKPALRIAAVGLGTGSVAAYVRGADRLTFFEIDPLVIRISSDPAHFSYTTQCAKGRVDYVVGDARLTVAKQPPASFDVLLLDAFSSDSVPAHLMTVEAVRGYLTKLKPDGVLILHLSNRNLELAGPAQAVATAAGGMALYQNYRPASPKGFEVSEDALIVVRSPAGLARFAGDGRWVTPKPTSVRPWTDDYTNLAGAMWRKIRQKMAGVE